MGVRENIGDSLGSRVARAPELSGTLSRDHVLNGALNVARSYRTYTCSARALLEPVVPACLFLFSSNSLPLTPHRT